jgi:hypothetical protein
MGRLTVDDPREITPDWMTAALREGGDHVVVTALSFERIGTGKTGATYRFHLTHEGDGPDTVVIKTAAGTPEQRAGMRRAFQAETFFYRTLAPRARIQAPRCWRAAVSEDGASCTLVLADAHPATAGAQERGCSLAQARAALLNLAGLHAPFWNSPILAEEAGWLRMTEARVEMLAGLHVRSTGTFLDWYADAFTPQEADILRRSADLTPRWMLTDFGRNAVLHGDYRLDNLLFAPDEDGPVLAVDWQTLDIGLPGRDLAYFLATALEIEERRRSEQNLVRAYHDQLVAYGLTGFSLETCQTDYRLGMLQVPFITVVGCVVSPVERTLAGDRMFISMAKRAIRAIEDLEVLELVASGAA